jgi:hypothetical protein
MDQDIRRHLFYDLQILVLPQSSEALAELRLGMRSFPYKCFLILN